LYSAIPTVECKSPSPTQSLSIASRSGYTLLFVLEN
jgi:hypothetical protein